MDEREQYATWLGPPEAREDLPPLRREIHDPMTGLVREVFRPMIGRRRYETWVEDGQKMGRWTWESAQLGIEL